MRNDDGFTLIELLVVVAITGIIAAIAVPGLLRARMSGNEVSAVGSLRAINNAQAGFSANCGFGAYAGSLVGLSLPVPGQQGFLGADLAGDPIQKSGYLITLTPGPAAGGLPPACTPAPQVQTYAVNADPVQPGSTGNRYFFTNSDTIWAASVPIAPVQTGNAPAASATPLN